LPATGDEGSTTMVPAMFIAVAGALVIAMSRRRRTTQG
jgi:LPXTG-motif cell wall-anchored protein